MVTRVRALALLNSPFASLPHSFFCQWLLPVLPTNNPQICPPPSSIAATDRDAARPWARPQRHPAPTRRPAVCRHKAASEAWLNQRASQESHC